jgi:hypothetical protein
MNGPASKGLFDLITDMSTSKPNNDSNCFPNDLNPKSIEITDEQKKQIEFYAWIFKKRNYPVASVGYLLFYTPVKDSDTFEWSLKFDPYLCRVEIDDSWVQKSIDAALECLESDNIPTAGTRSLGSTNKCDLCNYFDRLTTKLKKALLSK